MRRLFRTILLVAVFLGGYYLGRKPNSPDIFAWSVDTYHRVDKATKDITAKAEQDETNVAQAALSYLLSPSPDAARAQD